MFVNINDWNINFLSVNLISLSNVYYVLCIFLLNYMIELDVCIDLLYVWLFICKIVIYICIIIKYSKLIVEIC